MPDEDVTGDTLFMDETVTNPIADSIEDENDFERAGMVVLTGAITSEKKV